MDLFYRPVVWTGPRDGRWLERRSLCKAEGGCGEKSSRVHSPPRRGTGVGAGCKTWLWRVSATAETSQKSWSEGLRRKSVESMIQGCRERDTSCLKIEIEIARMCEANSLTRGATGAAVRVQT